MYEHSTYGRYVTDQVLAQIEIAHKLDDIPMQTQAVRIAEDMMSKLEAGSRRAPKWINDRLQKVDKNLKLRFDFDQDCYVLDRHVRQFNCHMTVTSLPGFRHSEKDVETLVTLLKAGDMQRHESPAKFKEEKDSKAAKVRASNSKRGDEIICNAVDSLSDKSVTQFLQVEKALRTGERVYSTGQDAKTLEVMAEAGKNAPPPPPDDYAMNPGSAPNRHQHIKGNK